MISPVLTDRDIALLTAICDPTLKTSGEIAEHLGLTPGSLKVTLVRIYAKFGGPKEFSIRRLTLWALAHREELGIPLPVAAQFGQIHPRIVASVGMPTVRHFRSVKIVRPS